MFCTNCGKTLPDNAQFCPGCGQVISAAGRFNGGAAPPGGPPGNGPMGSGPVPNGPAGGGPMGGGPVYATHRNGGQQKKQTYIVLGLLAVLLAIVGIAAYFKWDPTGAADKEPNRAQNQRPSASSSVESVPPSTPGKSYYDMDFTEIYAEFLGTYQSDSGYTFQIGYNPATKAPAATLDYELGAKRYYLDTISTDVERADWVSLNLATSSQDLSVRFAPNYDNPQKYQAVITTATGETAKLTDVKRTSITPVDIPAPASADVFPHSSTQLLNSWEVEALSNADLTYAINEIYARHGYIFKSEELRLHFEQFDWYHGTIPADAFSYEMLNSIEQQNLDLMAKERDRRK